MTVLASCAAVRNPPSAERFYNTTELTEFIERAETRVISFEASEGTFLNIDVSPDGDYLAFDLLGDIYLLPISGGTAVPILTGRAWTSSPRFSSDGRSIFFVSDQEEFKNIWQVDLSSRVTTQLTDVSGDIETINWSHNRKTLIAGVSAAKTDGIETILHNVDPFTGKLTAIEDLKPFFDVNSLQRFRSSPVSTFSGASDWTGHFFFSDLAFDSEVGRPIMRLHKFDPRTGQRIELTQNSDVSEFKPQSSPNGKFLAYIRQYNDRRTELRLLEVASGEDRLLTTLSNADDSTYYATHDSWPNYAFTPDSDTIVLWDAGQLRRISISTSESKLIPYNVNVEFETLERIVPSDPKYIEQRYAKVIRWPSVSAKEDQLTFAALGHIWIQNLGSGETRKLTGDSEFGYMPTFSPDGTQIAYISYEQEEAGYGPARLVVANVNGVSPIRIVLVEPHRRLLLPKWSPDGKRIAIIRESSEVSEASPLIGEVEFGWINMESRKFTSVSRAPTSAGYAMRFHFSRYIGFDDSGERILFSHPISRTATELRIANLDGSEQRRLTTVRNSQRIVPSPDLTHLAATGLLGQLFIVPFSENGSANEIDLSRTPTSPISQNAVYYENWSSENLVTYGLANSVFEHDVRNSEATRHSIKIAIGNQNDRTSVALVGAKIVTVSGDKGAGEIIDDGVIVFRGSKITSVGQKAFIEVPNDALLIDASNKIIIPGLIDTHYHRIGGRGDSSGYRFPNTGFQDRTAIAYGVTSAWEPGGVGSDGAPATADLQAAGRILGPRWAHSAMGSVKSPLERLLHHTDADLAVLHRKTIGASLIKEYLTPKRSQRQWLGSAARNAGVGVISHIDNFEDMITYLSDGFTGGDHPYIPAPLYNDVKEVMAQTGYIWTPNIVITLGSIGSTRDKDRYFWRLIQQTRPKELEKFEALTGRSIDVVNPSVPYALHRVSRVANAVADAAKQGIRIGVSAHNMPAIGLHQEMWHLTEGGMPIADVLRATTMTNAEKIGWQHHTGSIEVGKLADFLVLDRDPLVDILNSLSIAYTVQGGRFYDAIEAENTDPIRFPFCTPNLTGNQLCRDNSNNLSRSLAWLRNNSERENVTVLPSGLQYMILEDGNPWAESMVPNSYVCTHASGHLISGHTFWHQTPPEEAISFKSDEVIRGWGEILTLMHPGDVWEVYVPPSLGYAADGWGDVIGPHEALIFKIWFYGSSMHPFEPGVDCREQLALQTVQ